MSNDAAYALDELSGEPIASSTPFSDLRGRLAWDEEGELWRIHDFTRTEYWGERVLEIRSPHSGWGEDAGESTLRVLSFEKGSWLLAMPQEDIERWGKALAESRALDRELGD